VAIVYSVDCCIATPAHFTYDCNPHVCPCGWANDAERQCSCSAALIAKYQKRVSGPLLDRIDMYVDVPRV
jgi:magnesium chelatase family protein